MSHRPSLLDELKRRKVVRGALVYIATSFAAIQAADVIFPVLRLPDWALALVVGLAAVGFPVAVGLAWVFDLTPEGVRRSPGGDEAEASETPTPQRWFSVLTVALVVVMLVVGIGAGWMARSASSSARAEAVATLDGITRPSWQLPATSIAMAYVRLGEHGKALDWLQRAYDGGDVALPFVFRDPAFAPVRAEPDFVALAAKIGVAVP